MKKSLQWNGERQNLFWPITALLALVWVLALMTGPPIGGLLHFLLAVAIAMALIRFSQGRRPA